MENKMKAKEPFIFHTRLSLTELTGMKASTLKELAGCVKEVPGSSIYHHTHRFLQQHQYLSPEPPNDFAYWVGNVLGEKELAEELASIDTIQFGTIADLRSRILATIENYLKANPAAALRFSGKNEPFYFMKSVSIVFATERIAYDLKEFSEALADITVDSLYYHVFEARLRLEHGENDFSYWLRSALDEPKLADEISRLDPYTYTLDELRIKIIHIVKKRIRG